MNASTETKKAHDLSLTQTAAGLLRHYLGRRALIALAVAAAGIAPLLLALAPCAAMCALGLCMNKGGGKGPK